MNKWIILGNHFISGNVDFHAEIIPNNGRWKDKDVLGGGLFLVNRLTKTLILFGESMDYGQCKISDISIAEFHFRWDDWTILFTTCKDFKVVQKMQKSDFEWVRDVVKDFDHIKNLE